MAWILKANIVESIRGELTLTSPFQLPLLQIAAVMEKTFSNLSSYYVYMYITILLHMIVLLCPFIACYLHVLVYVRVFHFL